MSWLRSWPSTNRFIPVPPNPRVEYQITRFHTTSTHNGHSAFAPGMALHARGRVKSPYSPISGSFSVIPAKVGIQDFQTLMLGPRFRGDDVFWMNSGVFAQPGPLSDLGGRVDGRLSWVMGLPTIVASKQSSGRLTPQAAGR